MDFLKAFLVGGAICALVQILMDRTKLMPGRIMVLLVCTGTFLGFLGIYDPFIEWAGAGATVPLTGFGNLLARGVREAVATDGLLGALTGGFTAAAGGIAAAIFFGLIVALVFKSKDKAN